MAGEGAGRAGGKLRDFLALIEGLRGELATLPLDQLLSLVLDRTGYLDALAQEGTPEAESRRDNLLELIASAREFAAENAREPAAGADGGEERSPLELFLDQVALVSDLDGWQDRAERVSLMTVHTAKGLEFPVVFLVGMEERIFPHASASGDDASLEEERRLCYVAMTRAMDELHLTHAGVRLRYGERSFQLPSRFLREIPEPHLERVGARRSEPRGAPSRARGRDDASFDYSYSQEAGDDSDAVRAGTRVRHPVFGTGQIVGVSGSGLGQKLRIRFDRVGIKTVVVRYANLELL
jgi:DNA helicase-2/ATP-dependent DNA helicase PcrA